MKNLDKYRACLLGGTIGDALGYPLEFMDSTEIFDYFKKRGTIEYVLKNGVAQISDDTN